VQTRVCQQPEDQSRWSVRTLAAELGLPSSTVHAMLVRAKLQPHRIRTFTFSPDPDFEAKLLDIVGLYLNPPGNPHVFPVRAAAYSALASFRIGMSGSASFQSVRKSLYAVQALAVSPCIA
jgi:hypothetical protein